MNQCLLQNLRASIRVRPSSPSAPLGSFANEEIDSFFARERLRIVFQPILDIRRRHYYGYEALLRGPEGSPCESPVELFAFAEMLGRANELEAIARQLAVTGFAQHQLKGKLFLNASLTALADDDFARALRALLAEVALRPADVVLEVTERQGVEDHVLLREVLDAYRATGLGLAIDDLGEGFANLRLWSELRPDYIKIDRHFIHRIATDGLKFQIVKAMQNIAETCSVRLIAEGVEEASELTTLRDLGLPLAQGFLIERPTPSPATSPSDAMRGLLDDGRIIVFPKEGIPRSEETVRRLSLPVMPVFPETDNETVFRRFEENDELFALPVVDKEGRPIGLIDRHRMIDGYARPYRRELYGRKSCTKFMFRSPLIVEAEQSVQEVARLWSQTPICHNYDGFIIAEKGRYLGLGNSRLLMGTITDMQIRAARYANPLTQLPGNVPINEHMDRLLSNHGTFVACHADLDHFKPYNDIYGYRKGDELIVATAEIMQSCCDKQIDFLGHVGGDDFILLLQSHDWHERLSAMIHRFDRTLPLFLHVEHQEQGGYFAEDRQGRRIFHPLPALSIGAVMVPADHGYPSHRELIADLTEAKKQAKKKPGSTLFVERRRSLAWTEASADKLTNRLQKENPFTS